MSRPSLLRTALHGVYLLPLLCFLIFCIYSAIPHIWFVYESQAHETVSLFELWQNVSQTCQSAQNSGTADEATLQFADLMGAASVFFWIVIALYGIFALATAVCSTVAFLAPPTSVLSNKTKRILGLICPSRIVYLLLSLLPLLPALFPHLLTFAYRTFLGLEIKAHAAPFADWVLALILVALTVIPYIATLPYQASERLDLFRIYRAGNKPLSKGDERA